MTSISRRTASLVALVSIAIAAVGCGGGSDGGSAATASPADGTIGDVEIDDPGDLAEAVGADEVLSQVGIDTIGYALSSALGGEYEIVDDTTIRLTLEGELESDSVMSCIVAGGVVEPGTTVIVKYPDGEKTCE